MDKTCIVCGETKSIDMFYRANGNKDGYKNECKACKCTDSKRRRLENPGHHKKYAQGWYLKNKEKVKQKSVQWIANNIDQYRKYRRKKNVERQSTVNGRLNNRLSCAIRRSLVNGAKSRIHWENLVGYTVVDLRKHLEKQFAPSMNWGNYGKVWHIDHKIPIVAFNFSTPNDLDFKKCWSLKNLQPLLIKDNLTKSDKIDKPFQPSLRLSG